MRPSTIRVTPRTHSTPATEELSRLRGELAELREENVVLREKVDFARNAVPELLEKFYEIERDHYEWILDDYVFQSKVLLRSAHISCQKIRNPPVTFAKLNNLLLSEEIVVKERSKSLLLEANNKAFSAYQYQQAFLAQQRPHYGYSHPNSSFRPRGKGNFSFSPTYRGFSTQYRSNFQLPPRMHSPQSYSYPPVSAPNTSPASTSVLPTEPPCQLCNKNGHTTPACRHRLNFAYHNAHTLNNMSAMLATTNILGENPWYADSGANNHLTSDENELQLMSAYDGS
ncbi:uncharacterized protein LOC113360441 [Papaver somniferum]|uniref:uncharacterized protein LOC113360441 n=1 Tax=Papaver somniferum TaxID=3469 RepID=UPI000E70531C|nr:uncharacterized protein LOC113360441 [Papaver somniferum]